MVIDKVYDEFATTDWVYTQDNLNPVREIDYTGKLSIDDLRNRMLNNINARLDYLLEQQEEGGKAEFNEEEMGEALVNRGASKAPLDIFNNEVLDRMPSLKRKLLKLQFYMLDEDEQPRLPNFDDKLISNYFNLLVNFDCVDFDDAKAKQYSSDYFGSRSESDMSSQEFNEGLDSIMADGNYVNRKTGKTSSPNAQGKASCAQREMILLQIIIGLLTVILSIGKLIMAIQEIMTVIDDILATAITVWMFGMSIPHLKDLILNFIIPIVIWILSLILKLLYRLLDIRCAKATILEFLKKIAHLFEFLAKAISSFKNIVGITKSLPNMVKSALDNFIKKFSQLQVNVNINKQSMKDKLKEAFSFENFKEDLINGVQDAAQSTVMNSDLVKDAMEIYDAAMQAGYSASKAFSAITGDSNNALTAGLNKIAQKVSDFKVKKPGQS